MNPISTYTITASQLVSLLQILGALVADYKSNEGNPISKSLKPLLQSPLRWKELPSLSKAIAAAMSGGDKLTALYNVGAELKIAFSKFYSNKEYSSPELQMLKAIRAYLMTDSEPALKYIVKNASIFGSPELADAFMPEIPQADNNALQKVVKSLVGREGVFLSVPEMEALKETNPKGLEQYKALRKAHTDSFKATMMNYVRAAKKKLVPYKELYEYLASLGFTHSLVPGFTGMVDDQGKWYTPDGKLLNGVPNLTTYSHVIMNPKITPENQWVFKAVKNDGGFAYGYTSEFRREQSKAKYAKVRGLMKNIPAIRKRWLAKVRDFNIEDKLSVTAVVLEILYSFAARVGSQPGRGVATLVAKQARPTTQGINLVYLGKDSIPTKHVIKNTDPIHRLLLEALTNLLNEKSGNEFIFTYVANGKHRRCTPADVNAAFRAFGAPAELTVHKLRTTRGTTLFLDLMEKDAALRPPKDEKEALARYKKMTEEVGKLLNHKRGVGGATEKVTGTTAAGSYIDGAAQIDLWERWGFRLPKALEKLVRPEDE